MSDPLADIASIFDNTPKNIQKVFPGAVRVPTTDQMDGIFTAEDRANKYKVMAQCRHCNAWTQIEQWQVAPSCGGCGAKDYDPTSYTSLRSFDPSRKRIAKGYKKK